MSDATTPGWWRRRWRSGRAASSRPGHRRRVAGMAGRWSRSGVLAAGRRRPEPVHGGRMAGSRLARPAVPRRRLRGRRTVAGSRPGERAGRGGGRPRDRARDRGGHRGPGPQPRCRPRGSARPRPGGGLRSGWTGWRSVAGSFGPVRGRWCWPVTGAGWVCCPDSPWAWPVGSARPGPVSRWPRSCPSVGRRPCSEGRPRCSARPATSGRASGERPECSRRPSAGCCPAWCWGTPPGCRPGWSTTSAPPG